MSKSVGNVIDPIEYVEKYGTDAVRYYLLAKISPFEDSDFTKESFEQVYQADLANGIGNLVARIAKLCEINKYHHEKGDDSFLDSVDKYLLEYRFNDALENIWGQIRILDKTISEGKPWEIKDQKEISEKLFAYVSSLNNIAHNLRPFLPETAEKVKKQFAGLKIESSKPLFPRL